MKDSNQTAVSNSQKMNVTSLSIDKEDLLKLCNKLQKSAFDAADLEVASYKRNDVSDETLASDKQIITDSFLLKVTITGDNNEELFGTIEDVFKSPNFPENVKTLFIQSSLILNVNHNYFPRNSFKIFLDFTKPNLFDLSLMPSTKTPNESYLEVKGFDATWVNGVFSQIKDFISKLSSTLSIVHSHSIYDVLLWLAALPISFWMRYSFSGSIEKVFNNYFTTNALYTYTFIGTLFIFRILFHYLRWVCPLVEYKSKTNKMLLHRISFGTLALSWIGKFAYDLVKILLLK